MEIKFNINLTKKQREAWDALHDPDCQYLVARWSRQCGKTVFAEIMLIEYLLTDRFSAYISPTYSQGRKVYREIVKLLEGKGVIKKANASTLTIESVTGAQLQFFTMENPVAIRGYTVGGILVLDEVAFFPDELPDGSEPWSSIIMPITKARNPKVLLISTPKGKRGLFHQMYLNAVEGRKGYREISATIYDDDLVSEEEIEEIRAAVSPVAFDEEFLVKFIDSSMTFLKGFEGVFGDFKYDEPRSEWIGIDLSANGDDATILTKVNEKRQVRQYRIEGTLDMKYQQIADIINSSKNLEMAYLEINGIGAVMLNEIVKRLNNPSKVREWTTTNASKEQIVSSLAMRIAKKEIEIPSDEKELFSEMSTFIVRYTKTGHLQFEARAGYHDDRIMSLCMALRAMDDFSRVYTRSFAEVLRF